MSEDSKLRCVCGNLVSGDHFEKQGVYDQDPTGELLCFTSEDPVVVARVKRALARATKEWKRLMARRHRRNGERRAAL